MRRIPLFIIVLIVALVGLLATQQLRLASAAQEARPVSGVSEVRLPNKDGSVKFLILGDTGTGDSGQTAIATQVIAFRAKFPFEFGILLGDNLYGSERPSDYARKFERPYKPLLDAGVKFYASLGNHDDPNQRMYKLFNMNGERYYSFRPSAGVRFFALDSNYMDPKQVEWLEKELAASGSDWKIAFFHHPPYASGMHGSHEIIRNQLEPIFLKHGVNVVFTGHEHFYERIKPQKGIQYFVAGGSAKLRRGDISKTPLTAFGYDQARSFMVAEIDGDQMYFQAITDKGQVIDSGVVTKGANNRVVGTAGRPNPNAKPAPDAPKPGSPKPAPEASPKPESPKPAPASPR